jgi:anti-anti-sigma factor
MKLTIRSQDDSVVRLSCEGAIRQIPLAPGHDPLEELLGADAFRRRVLVDLEKADFIDSSGIGWMIVCQKHFVQAGGKLVFHSAPPLVQQVFDLLQLQRVLNVAADEAAARALAQEGRP